MNNAHHRLKGALRDAEEDDPDASAPTSAAKRPRKDSDPLAATADELLIKKTATKKIGRPRVKPIPPPPKIHQSYVMKLFDRSVDLAKFKHDTPLYPILKAWMQNQPRVKKTLTVPTMDQIEFGLLRKPQPELLTMIRNGIPAEVKAMPAPDRSKKFSRFPELLLFQLKADKNNIDLDYKLDNPKTGRETLFLQNMERWKTIKKHWQSHLKLYETRYTESFEILDRIYKQ